MDIGSRLFLGTLLFSSVVLGQTSQEAGTAPTVVFICEHGAAKSIIAAAEVNRLAEQKGRPHWAISRGTNPDPEFASAVIAGLRKDGLSAPAGKPRLISAGELKN